MRKLTLFSGLLLGGVLGTAAGILLAPKSGNEMRQDIKAQVNNGASKVKADLVCLQNDLNDKTRETMDEVRQWALDVAEDLNKVGTDTRNHMQAVAKVLQSTPSR